MKTRKSLTISNIKARWLFIQQHGLGSTPAGISLVEPTGLPPSHRDLLQLIGQLGFVQLDSISTVERAHHLILHSRLPDYRREHLAALHHEHAALFEHWTHDAALIPAQFYPHWRHRFRAARERLSLPAWQKRLGGAEAARVLREVRSRIRREGPLLARDFEDAPHLRGTGAWWGWGASKSALEYLWRAGELAIVRREGFEKVYDLSERVIPEPLRTLRPHPSRSTRWFCEQALLRLGFATPREIAAFWQHIPVESCKAWAEEELQCGRLMTVNIEGADGTLKPALTFADIEQRLDSLTPPPSIPRFLSPFDPLIRDRARTLRLFGFNYRLEAFVPAPRRQYGYYVLPLMEGHTFIARADLKTHRSEGRLEVKKVWAEDTRYSRQSLETALEQLGRFTLDTTSPGIDLPQALVFGS